MKKMFGGLVMAATMMTPLAPAFARPDSPRNHAAERGDRGQRAAIQNGNSRGEARVQRSRPQYQQQRAERPRAERPRTERPAPQRRAVQQQSQQRSADNRGRDRSRSDAPRRGNNWDGGNRRDWSGNREAERRRDDRNRPDNRNWDRNERRGDYRRDDRNDRRWNGNDNRYRGDRSRNWSRDWRHDRRYDWRSYRNSHRNYYRLPRYYSPYPHYGYRRFSIGLTLGSLFYGQRYWIDDPWYYRLPPAYGNYRWIRYYDDALLVDIYSGQVVDVIYDFFW